MQINPREAARYFQQALEGDPHAGGLWRNLAHAWRQCGEDSLERAALKEALELDQRDMAALIRLAELHERREEKREALLRWTAVLEVGELLPERSDDLKAILRHAKDYCDEYRCRMENEIRAGSENIFRRMSSFERRRSERFIDISLGKKRVFYNNCAGLYYPFLPSDEFFDDSHFQCFDIIKSNYSVIRDELLLFASGRNQLVRPYVNMSSGADIGPWSELNNSLNWSSYFLWEYGEPNLGAEKHLPKTFSLLASIFDVHIPGRAPNAFLSILRPKTRIPPHTGVTNTRAIVHVPLLVPDGCGIRVGGETRRWIEGQPFAFDDTIEHEAWNDSSELRVVLIFDLWNPHLTEREKELIADYFKAAELVSAE